MTVAPPGYLAVAAAVIVGRDRRILLSRRHDHAHQGGLWEFPGGKIEPGERPRQALRRELEEELGIRVERCEPLIQIPHVYPDRRVWLDVWRVERFAGHPHGRESQAVRWFEPADLPGLPMPPANRPIVDALRLPPRLAITPSPLPPLERLLDQAGRVLEGGGTAIQLRAPGWPAERLLPYARALAALCRERRAICFVNIDPEEFERSGAQGLHLPARRLHALRRRPVAAEVLLSAACHDLGELRRAADLGVNCALLSPVRATLSHPDQAPLGWARFGWLCARSRVPVYALGGMRAGDLAEACWAGAQGIAAVRSLWPLK